MYNRISIPNYLKDKEPIKISQFEFANFEDASPNTKVLSPSDQSQPVTKMEHKYNAASHSNLTEESFTVKAFLNHQIKSPVHQKPILNQPNSTQRQIQFESKKLTSKVKKRKQSKLNDVIFNQRVRKLKQNFAKKISRNNVYAEPKQCLIIKEQNLQSRLLDINGIQIGEKLNCFFNILFVANIICTAFISTLSLVFQQITSSKAVQRLQIVGIAIYLLEIGLNLVTVRITLGRKLLTVREISRDYLRENLYIDVINAAILTANYASDSAVPFLNICKIFILSKFPDWLARIKKLEVQFIENYYKEQYWQLAKVILFNFLYAHILSVVLLCMAKVNAESNWLRERGLTHAAWYEQYIWSYYWSTTVMLTIGFGDITPACYQEAMAMILVEVISCIILAYNINCVGSLISNIRAEDQERHRNQKIFKKLAEKNKVTEQLGWKINNFIEEHSNIKKMTNIEEQAKFIENLPTNYKLEYLKESNRHIFKTIYFFSSLLEKTLCALSQKIKVKIAHPLQILLCKQTNFDLLILKKGEIACKSNKNGFMINSNIFINKVSLEDSDKPFLLHTNFITKEESHYKILSTVFSLIYYLDYQSLMETLRFFSKDFELYCQLRDKSKYYDGEFQVFSCTAQCKSRHSDFDCPKYHFSPFKQKTINKELAQQKKQKNQRNNEYYRKLKKRQKKYHISTKSIKELFQSQINNEEKDLIKQRTQMRQRISTIIKQRAKSKPEDRPSFIVEKTLIQNILQAVNQQTSILRENAGEDTVWLVKSDELKDFRDYFPKNNPQNLALNIINKRSQFRTAEEYEKDMKLLFQFYANKQAESGVLSSKKQQDQINQEIRRERLLDLVKSVDIQKRKAITL